MTFGKHIASLVGLIGVLAAGNSGVWAIDVNLMRTGIGSSPNCKGMRVHLQYTPFI